jgi:large-conductance mechanosensitive channel
MINLKSAIVGFALIAFMVLFLLQKIRNRSERIKKRNKKKKNKRINRKKKN